MTSLEDILIGRKPQSKTTSMENNLKTSQEDDLTGRQPYRKTALYENNLTGGQPHKRKTLKEEYLGGKFTGR